MGRNVVAARVRALLDSGEYAVMAAVHPNILNLHSMVHIALKINGAVQPVLKEIYHWNRAVFVSRTDGAFQLVLELHCTDDYELSDYVSIIRAMPNVSDVRLHRYQRIARSACRTRLHRLLDNGATRIGLVRQQSSNQGYLVVGMGLTVRDDPEHVIEFFKQLSNAEFISRTFGNFDMILTVLVESPNKLVELLDELDQLDAIIKREVWLHMSVEFERYQINIDSSLLPAGVVARAASLR